MVLLTLTLIVVAMVVRSARRKEIERRCVNTSCIYPYARMSVPHMPTCLYADLPVSLCPCTPSLVVCIPASNATYTIHPHDIPAPHVLHTTPPHDIPASNATYTIHPHDIPAPMSCTPSLVHVHMITTHTCRWCRKSDRSNPNPRATQPTPLLFYCDQFNICYWGGGIRGGSHSVCYNICYWGRVWDKGRDPLFLLQHLLLFNLNGVNLN